MFENRQVIVLDRMDPEVLAMLQAFYSRSDKSITERLNSLGDDEEHIKESLKRYYIGYGHSSIADCADITLFIENVSFLMAKTIQDDSLYNGQETSTRYFDFENREIISPLSALYPALTELQKQMVALYAKIRPRVLQRIREAHPFVVGVYSRGKEMSIERQRELWENATNARSFDITRGLLPAGMTTQLSWKASLRRIGERLNTMQGHPCLEMNSLARSLLAQLQERYPSSFKMDEAPENYPFYDLDTEAADMNLDVGEVHYKVNTQFREMPDTGMAAQFLLNRSRFDVVPNYYNMYGEFMYEFLLDWGSYRDIQRHRNGQCAQPMLGAYSINGTSNMFHPWYLEQMGEDEKEVSDFIYVAYQELDKVADHFQAHNEQGAYEFYAALQYYYPLGTVVPVTLKYGLAEAIYVAELRSQATVHPTLRPIAHQIARSVRDVFPSIPLFTDDSEDGLVIKRGSQTILERTDEA